MNNHGIDYREYQVAGRDAAFDEFGAGTESALIVMPTGTGKTVLAGMCVEEFLENHNPDGRKALFVAHREVLIKQAYDTLTRFGFDAAIEMGEHDARNYAATVGDPQVVIGSIQTLQSDRLMRWNPKEFGLVIIDEAHRSLADSYTKALNWFEGYRLIGITATPRRGDGRNLGARFRKKVYEYALRDAINEGWLVPIRTRECPLSIDLRGIKMHGDDFSAGELEERVGPRIEALARAFCKEVGDRKFVAFLPGVGTSMAFAQVCDELGKSCRYVAGTGGSFGMRRGERNDNLAAFEAGEFQGVACCELLIEGWDCPQVEAVGIGRVTTQQYRYTQMVGRGTRPSPATGKKDCLVIDFDWRTDKDSKDLCSTVDLFDDGSIDEEVFAVARKIAAERAVDVNPLDAIEEAEQIIRTRNRFAIRLTGKEEKYQALEYDPVGVSQILDIKLNRRYDLDRQGTNPASAKQLGLLASLGMTVPDGLSKWGASKMIDKIMKRREQGLASIPQVQALLSVGVDTSLARAMTSADASDAISKLDKVQRYTQRSLFA